MDRICEIFLVVCNMSLTASAVVCLVILARYGMRRLPRCFSYYLWAIVGFRLICPYSLPSIFSMFNLSFFQNRGGSGSQIIWASSEMLEKSANLSLPLGSGLADGASGISGTVNAGGVAGTVQQTAVSGSSVSSGSSVPYETVNTAVSTELNVLEILAVLWLLGAAVFLIYQVLSYRVLCRRVETAVQFQKGVYECDRIQSPFVMGFARPRIYVPFRMAEKERDYILLHEQYHIRRRDYQVKVLAALLLAVYWFNPVIWLAYYLMCKDMEMSCDEKVIAMIGREMKGDYSRSLLKFASGRKNWAASPLAFGDVPVKARVKNVLNFRNPKGIAVFLGIVVCILAAVIGIGNGERGNSIRNATPPEEKDGTITYEYEVPDGMNSCLVYREWYEGGVLTDYEILDAWSLEGMQKSGSFTLERDPFLYTQEGYEDSQWDSKMTFRFPEPVYTKTDYLSLLNRGYIGVADTYYLENENGWEKLEQEQDIVLAAWNLASNGDTEQDAGGVEAIPCREFMQTGAKYDAVARNDGVILYHLRFSEKDVEKLREEYKVSPYAKELYSLYNPYVGDAAADGALIDALSIEPSLPRTVELQTEEEPYGLILHFEEAPEKEYAFYQTMLGRATALLAFTGNLDQVEWTYTIETEDGVQNRRFCMDRDRAEELLGVDSLDRFAESEEAVQIFLDQFLPYVRIYYETLDYVGTAQWADYKEGVQSVAPTGGQYAYTHMVFGKLPGEAYDSAYYVLSNEEQISFRDVAEAVESGGSSDLLYVRKEINTEAAAEAQEKEKSGGYLAFDGNVYQHREILIGRHPNAESESAYLVYFNDDRVTFEDVTEYLLGSLMPKKEMYVLSLPSYLSDEEK